jgi:succinate dehydrogenase/fumarate reductase flavoprotein subunit
MLHALYQQSLKYDADFFIEYFALDLIMEGRRLRRRDGLCLDDGSIHRFRAKAVVLATGGYGRAYYTAPAPTPAPATAAGWCCARACRCRTWNSSSSTRPASTAPAC